MKIYLITIAFLTLQCAYGQSANQKDIVEILNIALLQGKLPDELINKSNPEIAPWTNAPFIVVKSDTLNHLGILTVPPDSTHVWIFDYEQIFLFDIAYGLVPLSITRKQARINFDYKTIRYWTNKNHSCHSGRLMAEKENDTWTIIESNTKVIECEIDSFGQKK